MDYKEKLQEAKRLYESATADQKYVLESLFPEIRESEDERIRKEIITFIATTPKQRNSHSKWLAWLEKQGEQKSIWHNEDEEPRRGSLILLIMQSGTPIVAQIIEPNHTFNHGERWAYIDDLLEKQGEQKSQRMISAEAKEAMYNKPADTVEPKCEESKTKVFDAPTPFEDKLYAFVLACEILVDPSKREFILEHSQEILDAAREQIGKEQSSAWSKEDEKMVDNILTPLATRYPFDIYQPMYNWLKSLKQRIGR